MSFQIEEKTFKAIQILIQQKTQCVTFGNLGQPKITQIVMDKPAVAARNTEQGYNPRP